MVVHPGHGNYRGTLVNALTYHLKDYPLFQQGDMRAGLVHRIDKNTSGILVVAKNEHAHVSLAKQFFDHSIDRVYKALVWGNMPEDEGRIEGNIGRSIRDRLKMAVFPEGDAGKHAVTHWRVIERLGYVNLIECKLETGRTHQIRVHLSSKGSPIVGDEIYGGGKLLPRQALHARSLSFVHPFTNEQITLTAPLPEDMKNFIEEISNEI